MVQTYVQFQLKDAGKPIVVKPSLKKLFLRNLFSLLLIAIILVVVLLWMGGPDLFSGFAETFGWTITPAQALMWAAIAIIVICVGMLGMSFLSMGNVRYEFYADKMVAFMPQAIVLMDKTEIPYQNVVKLSYEKKSVFDSLLGAATIILEITGMDKAKVELPSVDDPQETVQRIQEAIANYTSVRQAQFDQNYRIQNIMNRM
jgi:hypothetical protein